MRSTELNQGKTSNMLREAVKFRQKGNTSNFQRRVSQDFRFGQHQHLTTATCSQNRTKGNKKPRKLNGTNRRPVVCRWPRARGTRLRIWCARSRRRGSRARPAAGRSARRPRSAGPPCWVSPRAPCSSSPNGPRSTPDTGG